MFNLLIALGLDLLLGEPEWLPHPVVAIGKLIEKGEGFLRFRFAHQRLAGILLVCGVVGISFGLSLWIVHLSYSLHPLIGHLVSIILIYTTISLNALAKAASSVHEHLVADDLDGARAAVSHIVGRDTENLDETEVIRATIESVAENSIDGVVAPFFYAFIGGAPLAIAYKAINTLDSMIGYKNEQYIEFGWAAARLDDLVNYIPARLSYILIPIAAGGKRMARVFNIIARDGRKHPSPNSGLPESGFAAALNIQLGGDSYYEGILSSRPLIGDCLKELRREDITKAIKLLYRAVLALIILFIIVVAWC